MRAGVADSKWNVETTRRRAVWWPRLGDERLARLAARGNPRAYAAVYERYHQVLYRYCRSILRDDADAQDALQSTFTRALSALKRGQRSAPLRPWLFRIAHNEAISVLRRRTRGEESLADPSLALAASAEDQAGERARIAILLGDLAALPDRARSALVMRELSGLSHEEIAIALQTTPGAAKQAIFEARRGLQECAEGRAMACTEVCQAISEGDRRLLRGRRMRAHLRDCGSCAAFAAAIDARRTDLRALVPVLPAAASAALLSRTMHTAAGYAGGGGGAAAAGAAGKTIGIAFTSKGFATASVLATAAVSVGGVAAVVRLAPETGRLAKERSGSAAQVRAAHHARSASQSGSAGNSGSGSRASSVSTASSVGSVRGAGHTGAAGRHVRFGVGHGHGGAVGWHRTTPGAYGEFGRGRHDPGGSGWQRGFSQPRQSTGTVTGVRHGAFEGYGGGPGDNGALEDRTRQQGHYDRVNGSGSGSAGNGGRSGSSDGRSSASDGRSSASDGRSSASDGERGHRADATSWSAPTGNQHGRNK